MARVIECDNCGKTDCIRGYGKLVDVNDTPFDLCFDCIERAMSLQRETYRQRMESLNVPNG